MKIIDLDAKFFKYARSWVAKHPGLNEDQIENSYNTMMQEWINTPDPELDGATPATYFDRFTDAEELVEMMRGYHEAKVNLPEPLYARIVEESDSTAPLLRDVLMSEDVSEALRAEAMSMLRDIGDTGIDAYLIKLVCSAEQQNELSDLAADILSEKGCEIARKIMDLYMEAPEYAQKLILDIESNYPGDGRVTDELIYRLKNRPEDRALNASLLKKLGDPRALEALEDMLQLYELRYFDYLEIRDAIESLGGEPVEERSFYGDPDFEALRNLE